jgi:pimeloyl-ACP methyl ester carboxylesterase
MLRRIWKIVKLTALTVLALAVTAVVGALGYRGYRHAVIARATAIDPEKGIDEEFFASIGGIEQWISIRGQNRENPVLLLVHGGPGFAMSFVSKDIFFDWTRDFTFALWDQRGAGKTYGKSGPLATGVTIDRMAQDGIEVAELLRRKMRKPKIVLVGLSWGSMLGVRMARARPDLFYAYVGTGQSVNQYKYKRIAYEQVLAEARRRGNKQAVDQLEAIGPPPYDVGSKEGVHTKWATRFEPGQMSMREGISLVLFDSPAGPLDLRDYIRGLTSSDDFFREQEKSVDLLSLGTDFALPFFVFQGAVDNVTPVAPVQEYMNQITAPHKELVLIPNAGHNVIVTRSEEFLKLLRDRVRPLTSSP